MTNEYKTIVRDVAEILDAQMILDLHIKSLEMTLYHMFDDNDCEQYQDVSTEMESARHNLHLRMLSMLHSALFAALNAGTSEDEDKTDNLEGIAAREAQP